MPAADADRPRSLSDFADLLERLGDAGFDFAVIGGIAVGAYGRLRGQEVVSHDLDIYTDSGTLSRMLEWLPRNRGRVVKRPQPRSVPVAVFEWQGAEVNILTESSGFPKPEDVIRLSREFRIGERGLRVLVADPFDLLRNKKRVGRDKDRAHAEVLRAFVEEEVVAAFRDEEYPRDRIRRARQYLEATGAPVLPEHLTTRLLDLARLPSDYRFLVSTAPNRELVDAVLERAPADAELREELAKIAAAREFE